jgi:hypothetical protein
MIHFTLRGGLANMMFQIAAVNSIALKNNTQCSFHNLDDQLNYINQFRHKNTRLKDATKYRDLNFFKDTLTNPVPPNINVYTYPFHYEDIQIAEGDAGLDGFFQSEKYFKEHEGVIRELFKPTDEVVNVIKEKYSDILNQKTTSIHVRRGDYLKHPNHHPVQTLQYYQKGIELTIGKTDKYIIFSDDIPWCREVFKGDKFIFMEDEDDYIEMYLMSMCDNNIIANSSFSWWGAWLNNRKDKTVVGPKNWFGPAYSTWNTNDVLPEEWIKI